MNPLFKLLTFVLFSLPLQFYGQTESAVTYKDAVALFMRSEIKLKHHRDLIAQKGIFEDPLGYDQVLFKTIKSESPDLFKSTIKYKNHLLRMLSDSSLKKSEEFDLDIVKVLYNLCIDDYVDVLENVHVLFKNDQISFYVFENSIFQNLSLSYQVARNYKNEKLQSFLYNLQQDSNVIKRIYKIYPIFEKSLKELISGKLWENDLKEAEKIQPPLLKHGNCK